jgi:hypothetical protein
MSRSAVMPGQRALFDELAPLRQTSSLEDMPKMAL